MIIVALIQDGVIHSLLNWNPESSFLPQGFTLRQILETDPPALDVGWLYDEGTDTFSPPV